MVEIEYCISIQLIIFAEYHSNEEAGNDEKSEKKNQILYFLKMVVLHIDSNIPIRAVIRKELKDYNQNYS